MRRDDGLLDGGDGNGTRLGGQCGKARGAEEGAPAWTGLGRGDYACVAGFACPALAAEVSGGGLALGASGALGRARGCAGDFYA